MTNYVVRFRIGGNNSGAYFYEKMIEEGLKDHGSGLVSFSTIKPKKSLGTYFGSLHIPLIGLMPM